MTDLDQELEAALEKGSRWGGSPELLWGNVEREIQVRPRRAGRRVALWTAAAALVAVAATVMILAFGQQRFTPVGPRTSAGPERLIPTMSGVVAEIADGQLELSDVTYSPNVPKPHPAPRVPVPAGRWLTPTHWQSEDGALDLFRGQAISYFLDSQSIMPDIQPSHGVVRSVSDGVLELEVYSGDSGRILEWRREGPQTFRLSPHSLQGNHGDAPGRVLKPGDMVVVLWYGEPDYKVIWQFTFLKFDVAPPQS